MNVTNATTDPFRMEVWKNTKYPSMKKQSTPGTNVVIKNPIFLRIIVHYNMIVNNVTKELRRKEVWHSTSYPSMKK